MKIGDKVIHRKSNQRLVVKDVHHGNAMVLCCWMGTSKTGGPVECRAAFAWQELRSPTPEELAAWPAAPAPAAASAPQAPPGAEPDTSPEEPLTNSEAAAVNMNTGAAAHASRGKRK
jgi:hypothetical protein